MLLVVLCDIQVRYERKHPVAMTQQDIRHDKLRPNIHMQHIVVD